MESNVENRSDGNKAQNKTVSRRSFLSGVLGAAAFTVVSPHVVGANGKTPPSEKLNIAGVGVGGRGRADVGGCDSENIVALCDVDKKRAAGTFKKYPKAKQYSDFRRMLDKEGDNIDAVVVATPDHTHAVVGAAAMKSGKDVYIEKPLTHSLWEARQLGEIAEKTGAVTQMGNQGHSKDSVRKCREWVETGVIGTVREVHCWTNRPIWPQGEVKSPKNSVPDTLDWDLWLGPAKKRPYSPAYLPFDWRGWQDFGTGAFGDMGCHIMDMPFYALQLGHPVRAEAISSKLYDATYPESTVVRYEFPARDGKPGVNFSWYSGGLKPPIPDSAPSQAKLGGNGVILIGDKGALVSGNYGSDARIYPLSKMRSVNDTPKKYSRVRTSHHKSWINACKKGEPDKPASNFSYSVPLTETVLLGTVAILAQRPLEWDAKNLKVTNVPEANRFVRDDYRKGWRL